MKSTRLLVFLFSFFVVLSVCKGQSSQCEKVNFFVNGITYKDDIIDTIPFLNCLLDYENNTGLNFGVYFLIKRRGLYSKGIDPQKISGWDESSVDTVFISNQLASLFVFSAILDSSLFNKTDVALKLGGDSYTRNLVIVEYKEKKQKIINPKKKIYKGYYYKEEHNEDILAAYQKCRKWLEKANKVGIENAGDLGLEWK